MTFLDKIKKLFSSNQAFSSKQYWDSRYSLGGNSGAGSYGQIAEFKAQVVNDFVAKNAIQSVIDFGCGDGNQLQYAQYPHYIGIDVSPKAIEICKAKYKEDSSKSFEIHDEEMVKNLKGDLTLSMEVIFHLVEDDVYFKYLSNLFESSTKYVCVYSTDYDLEKPKDINEQAVSHVRHRKFTNDVMRIFPHFKLIETVETPFEGRQASKFFFFEKERA
ncbi:class I SAM-dependent methyltransferase [Hugenholtzia roseola]|uniref:class I SAM-dependent methyltransferase n=1 Tax=Hugenholtzia roseola TaxID=1002 RepID=UPI00040430CC|nr:class I SAM-dependent methyltransferase [Hugenholtzia roseola]